jgi:hypothetical protein
MKRKHIDLRLPPGAPHVRVGRGGSPRRQSDDWTGIIVAVIVIAIVIALLT